MPGSLCNVHKGHTTRPRMWLCPPNPGSEQQIMVSIAKPPLENIAWLCVMAACNILAPHRIPKNKCISPRWPMNQRAMHHHDKLEDTWHAANIRWHTHSHVSRVRSLNEQALQCVCGTGKTPTCHSNWWVCGPPAGCPSRVHNARTASTPEPCLDRVASPASTWATAAPSDTEPLACPISSSRKVGVNFVRAVAMTTFLSKPGVNPLPEIRPATRPSPSPTFAMSNLAMSRSNSCHICSMQPHLPFHVQREFLLPW